MSVASRIEDYALIGDCETVALVGKDGSIDWLCLPRFDSGACFAALLGTPENGRWQIAPAGEVRAVRRRYRPGTLILETEYETESGTVVLIDSMPLRSQASDLLRVVACRKGQVAMRMELIVRFDYGSVVPWVRRSGDGLWAIAGPDALHLHTPVPVQNHDFRTTAEFTLMAGERAHFTLTWHPSHLPEPPPRDPERSLQEAEDWWREWSDRCTYDGPWRENVLRSLITLKALTYAPTGGLVAAPTTSLPEHLGGVRNWDYRYCWIRDATFTLYALMENGYLDEARAWRDWLVRAVAGKPAEMQTLYGVAGARRLTELSLPWLTGYENSRPVRIGNAASNQHQLDVYGEVMDALHLARSRGLSHDDISWRVQKQLMDFLEGDWRQPDEGIWEVRGPRRHFTHSKVMAWVAADRAVKAVEQFSMDGPVAKWRQLREDIHEQVCRDAFDAQLNAFTQYYGSGTVDASLLVTPLVGFLPATDPRVLGTVAAIERNLLRHGFVDRYATLPDVDGLPAGEGVFLICSFWLADNYALQGRYAEARQLFERLLGLCNDVGLLSEEYEPETDRHLGNFPQAFSHIGLINTARNLTQHAGPAQDRQAT
jgi:GH15 family glucan-1,4-alpha-glucosidase